MQKNIIEGARLLLRRAETTDLDYIMELQHKPENRPFIVPYERTAQTLALREDGDTMNLIVAEKETQTAVGYLFISGLHGDNNAVEWTHVIIDAKGRGYGHEAMRLLKKWSFEVKKFHRGWLDCKDYNERALQLYEHEGLSREGFLREVIRYENKYENLIILGILDREYFARREQGLEL